VNTRIPHPLHLTALVLVLAPMHPLAFAAEPPVKTEHFDRDPGWEGRNNRIVPKSVPTVKQDFGYSAGTHFASKEAGEIGGTVWRASTPAWYAEKIPAKTLKDKLSASGTFAFTASVGTSGLFFGWFNAKQPGGSRPMQSLGMDFDGEGHGLRLAVRMITGSNKSCGTFITPFIPGKFRPTPIKNDGTRYTWSLTYDPDANENKGRFQFTIKSSADKHEEFEGKVFSVDLPDGFKDDEMVFDRFGMMNMGRPGNALTVYFGDLEHDGRTDDFSKDPKWDGSGNRITYQPSDVGGAHNFGFSADTNFAGGAPGEIGGVVWRTDKDAGWYADRVGPMTFDDRLEAGGKVMLAVGAPDSGVFIGWFNSEAKDKPPDKSGNFVGVEIAGPTRVGHYFRPSYTTGKGTSGAPKKGPVLVPGKPHQWTLLYDPAANDGNGTVQVTLDGESVTVNLKPGQKKEGARFDRFGMFSSYPGGGMVKIYFDDLKYTVNRSAP
jgi:hypothetical protein